MVVIGRRQGLNEVIENLWLSMESEEEYYPVPAGKYLNTDSSLAKIIKVLICRLKSNSRALVELSDAYVKHGATAAQENRIFIRKSTVRNEQVKVQVHCMFNRIWNIDTIQQTFNAELTLHAKWEEPELEKCTDMLNLKKDELEVYWDPQIIVTNFETSSGSHVTSKWVQVNANKRYPIIHSQQNFKGLFKQVMQLQHFPVDTQELLLSVVCQRPAHQVLLIEDIWSLSAVAPDVLDSVDTWTPYQHVDVVTANKQIAGGDSAGDEDLLSTGAISFASVDFSCHVTRKPNFFLWNICLMMFMLTSLTFTSQGFEVDEVYYRLLVTLVLLLTAVAFKFEVSKRLPIISYLTYLDLYVLMGVIFLSLQAVTQAGVYMIVRYNDKAFAEYVDIYVFALMLTLHIGGHLVSFSYVYASALKRRKSLEKRDRDQAKRRDRRTKYRGIS